jgi:N-methylhydantoinase B/oxoprolinase/acetone carboxylase alpha subunit
MVCEDRGIYETEEPGQEEKKEVRKGSDGSGEYHMGMLKEIRFDRVYNR